MFPDIGGTEYLIIAVVALLVFKPQDLPVIMKKVGNWVGQAKRMAADFRASFDDMARQSELDTLRKEVESMRSKATQMVTNPIDGLNTAVNETMGDINASLRKTPSQVFAEQAPAFEPFQPPAVPSAKPRKKAAPKTADAAPVKAKAASKAAAPASKPKVSAKTPSAATAKAATPKPAAAKRKSSASQ